MSEAASHHGGSPMAAMRTTATSLLMREWGEQRWRLASLLAIDLSLLVYAMLRDHELVIATAWILMILHGVLGSTFIAMGVAAGDRASGVLEFMRVLPVAPSRIMAVKLLVGAVLCVVPVAAMTVLLLLWPGLNDPHLLDDLQGTMRRLNAGPAGVVVGPAGAVLVIGVVAAGSAVITFLWATAAGVGRSSELRAGLAAIGVGVVWLVAVVAVIEARPFHHDLNDAVRAFSPAGLLIVLDLHSPGWARVVALQLPVLFVLAAFSMWRYGRVGGSGDRSPSAAPTATATGPMTRSILRRRRSPLTAIAWKQMRETLPLAVFGVFVIAALVTLTFFDGSLRIGLHRHHGWLALTGERLRAVTPALGFLVALVVGVGTFTADLQPRVLEFWRSRPISPALLFWTKYVTGAAVVLLALHLVPIVLSTWTGGWAALVGDPYVGCVPLMHLVTYTVAVFMACWLRRTVYAGILAFGVAVALILVPAVEPALNWFDVSRVMRRLAQADEIGLAGWLNGDYLPYFVTMAALSAALAAAAWLVMRRTVRSF